MSTQISSASLAWQVMRARYVFSRHLVETRNANEPACRCTTCSATTLALIEIRQRIKEGKA